jgi:hypothetical protein
MDIRLRRKTEKGSIRRTSLEDDKIGSGFQSEKLPKISLISQKIPEIPLNVRKVPKIHLNIQHDAKLLSKPPLKLIKL